MGTLTNAERSIAAGLEGALALLRARDYSSLEVTLSNLALDARSLALLGPEGADGIPVSHEQAPVDDRPLDEIVAEAINGRTALGYDSPAGAGHEVEADRG